jgi:hypothetical protein
MCLIKRKYQAASVFLALKKRLNYFKILILAKAPVYRLIFEIWNSGKEGKPCLTFRFLQDANPTMSGNYNCVNINT